MSSSGSDDEGSHSPRSNSFAELLESLQVPDELPDVLLIDDTGGAGAAAAGGSRSSLTGDAWVRATSPDAMSGMPSGIRADSPGGGRDDVVQQLAARIAAVDLSSVERTLQRLATSGEDSAAAAALDSTSQQVAEFHDAARALLTACQAGEQLQQLAARVGDVHQSSPVLDRVAAVARRRERVVRQQSRLLRLLTQANVELEACDRQHAQLLGLHPLAQAADSEQSEASDDIGYRIERALETHELAQQQLERERDTLVMQVEALSERIGQLERAGRRRADQSAAMREHEIDQLQAQLRREKELSRVMENDMLSLRRELKATRKALRRVSSDATIGSSDSPALTTSATAGTLASGVTSFSALRSALPAMISSTGSIRTRRAGDATDSGYGSVGSRGSVRSAGSDGGMYGTGLAGSHTSETMELRRRQATLDAERAARQAAEERSSALEAELRGVRDQLSVTLSHRVNPSSFDIVLEDPILLEQFKAYMVAEEANELVQFFLDAREYRKLWLPDPNVADMAARSRRTLRAAVSPVASPETILEAAQRLYQRYLAPGSSHELPCEAAALKKIEAHLKARKPAEDDFASIESSVLARLLSEYFPAFQASVRASHSNTPSILSSPSSVRPALLTGGSAPVTPTAAAAATALSSGVSSSSS